MNDRYLCRAKRIDNEEWVEGYIVIYPSGRFDIHKKCMEPPDVLAVYEVDPSTICQCTAMPDKNRKIAYEHDIIKTPVGNAKIAWSCSKSPTDNHINVGFEVVFFDAIANDNYRHDLGYWIGKSEVIGSVFDNQELLE